MRTIKPKPGETSYSVRIEGDKRNYQWSVRYDVTDEYLGITQFEGDAAKERVLLSPQQVRELLLFLKRNGVR
jgi:hypothetical protein